MGIGNPYQTYQNQAVTTASPGELTLMLYEGCLKFIRSAKTAMSDKDYELKNNKLVQAQTIIRELMVTLDRNVQISEDMLKMYDYIHQCLIKANVKNDLTVLAEAETYITEFRDTWKEIIQIDRKKRHGEGGQV